MLMDRNRRMLVVAIIFITFNVIVFAIPFQRNAVFWVAYVFSTITILALLAADWVAFRNADSLKRTFMGFPIIRIAFNCMLAQLAVSAVLMIASSFLPTWVAIIPSVLILAFGTISVILADWSRDAIEQIEESHIVKTDYMMLFRADLEALVPRVTDPEHRAKIENLSKTAKRSDPVSAAGLADLEADMGRKLELLKYSVINNSPDTGALIDELALLLNERNIKCRISKRH